MLCTLEVSSCNAVWRRYLGLRLRLGFSRYRLAVDKEKTRESSNQTACNRKHKHVIKFWDKTVFED